MVSLLAEGGNNKVVALSKDRVAKLFPLDEKELAIKEYETLHIANSINTLLPQVYKLEETKENCRLVMERLTVIQLRNFSCKEREDMTVMLHLQLEELHSSGLAHWDISRMADLPGERWDNVIPTVMKGVPCIRLIDMGNSKLAGHRLFERAVRDDRRDIENYTEYFLNI